MDSIDADIGINNSKRGDFKEFRGKYKTSTP